MRFFWDRASPGCADATLGCGMVCLRRKEALVAPGTAHPGCADATLGCGMVRLRRKEACAFFGTAPPRVALTRPWAVEWYAFGVRRRWLRRARLTQGALTRPWAVEWYAFGVRRHALFLGPRLPGLR